jgi:hypothetical protein
VVTGMVYHTVQCNADFGLAVEVLKYSHELELLI